MEKFTFFWKGHFSQWFPSKFVIDGISYLCAEQYMMARKATFFGDSKTLNKIMITTSPKEQKALGRTVKPFDINKWNAIVKEIVFKGNLAKFRQNPKLKDKLLDTIGTTLVEASPLDKIWGIGLSAKDEKALNRDTWQGTNWLGEILTNVREELLSEIK